MRAAIICAVLSFASAIHAQAPLNAVRVGVTLRTQSGGTPNQQRVRIVAEAGNTLPDNGLGRRARIGGTTYLFSAALADLPVPTYQPHADLMHWFSLVWLSSVSYNLPYAVVGHNVVFGYPSALWLATSTLEWLGPSPWDDYSIVSPPSGWQASFLTVRIPPTALLLGAVVSVQSYRLEPGMHLYVSDENIFVIG